MNLETSKTFYRNTLPDYMLVIVFLAMVAIAVNHGLPGTIEDVTPPNGLASLIFILIGVVFFIEYRKYFSRVEVSENTLSGPNGFFLRYSIKFSEITAKKRVSSFHEANGGLLFITNEAPKVFCNERLKNYNELKEVIKFKRPDLFDS